MATSIDYLTLLLNRSNFYMWIKQALSLTMAGLLLAFASSVMADSENEYQTDDGYVIHYNALNTGFLEPGIAVQYGITRSKRKGMLNVSVRKGEKNQLALTQAVKANVTAQAVNLSNQLKTIEMKEVPDGDVAYYIGVFGFSDQENLTFTITVDPEMQGNTHEIKFTQQFFVDKLN